MLYSEEQRARDELGDRLVTMGKDIVGEKHPGKDFVGMICHAITAGVDNTLGLRMVIQQTTVHAFARPGSYDDKVFRSVYTELEKNWF